MLIQLVMVDFRCARHAFDDSVNTSIATYCTEEYPILQETWHSPSCTPTYIRVLQVRCVVLVATPFTNWHW
ncbi:hypothetical protein M404DRAFT_1000260 [Pisolithus tinctorius Marx 270]|uniref:Uncharacterized protein n=1 Tax=Pisolithus tinctorius Marx 270 TaxID=870435 RepID=A0A0C3PAS8_PISTI|nr:hypothetical protein M404DRAFT_1000260 [Pisolithus tinctorius Marx 270]